MGGGWGTNTSSFSPSCRTKRVPPGEGLSHTLISALATQHIHHNLKLKTIFVSPGAVMMENWHRGLISDDPNSSPSKVCSNGHNDNDSEFPLVYTVYSCE